MMRSDYNIGKSVKISLPLKLESELNMHAPQYSVKNSDSG